MTDRFCAGSSILRHAGGGRGCFVGAIRIGGLLSRTVAFWLKRPAGGCRCIGRGSVLSCAGGAKRYFKASPRPGDGHGAGKRRPGREAAEPQRRASEQGSMSLPCREVWSLSVRCRSPPKRKFRARFLLKEPCPEFLRFSGFLCPMRACAGVCFRPGSIGPDRLICCVRDAGCAP